MTVLKLSCGDWRAEILPREGANLIRLTYRGRDVLRSRDAALQAGESLPLFGSPILFPANRTQDGIFTFRGREYRLLVNELDRHNHLHGMVMRRAFQVLEADGQRIRCRYVSTPEDYPFRFAITVTFSLSQNGLIQQYTLENQDKTDFPAVFGIHTAFARPDFLQIPIGPALERNDRFLLTGISMDLSIQENNWVRGGSYQGERLSGFYMTRGRSAKIGPFIYRVSELFDHWMLYGGEQHDFICVEPQAGRVNGLNCPKGHLLVPQNGVLCFTTMILKE